MPRIPSRPPLDLTGKWVVVELPTMMEDYLGLTPDPHVLITHTQFEWFSATFQFGAQQGEIDGRVDEVWTHAAAIFFTFVGTDEGDEISGAAADVGYNAAAWVHTSSTRPSISPCCAANWKVAENRSNSVCVMMTWGSGVRPR